MGKESQKWQRVGKSVFWGQSIDWLDRFNWRYKFSKSHVYLPNVDAITQFYTCSFMKMKSVKRFLYAVDTSSVHVGNRLVSESSVEVTQQCWCPIKFVEKAFYLSCTVSCFGQLLNQHWNKETRRPKGQKVLATVCNLRVFLKRSEEINKCWKLRRV